LGAGVFGSGHRLRSIGDADRGEAFGVLGLGAQRDQGFLQAGDLAEPDPFTGLGDPFGQVRLERGQTVSRLIVAIRTLLQVCGRTRSSDMDFSQEFA
jgi:hypothetical protein